jgi:hypothetical protein
MGSSCITTTTLKYRILFLVWQDQMSRVSEALEAAKLLHCIEFRDAYLPIETCYTNLNIISIEFFVLKIMKLESGFLVKISLRRIAIVATNYLDHFW